MGDPYKTEGLRVMGKCPICTINQWPPDNKPRVWPCGLEGCPYETKKEQAAIEYKTEMSLTGSGLAQIE